MLADERCERFEAHSAEDISVAWFVRLEPFAAHRGSSRGLALMTPWVDSALQHEQSGRPPKLPPDIHIEHAR